MSRKTALHTVQVEFHSDAMPHNVQFTNERAPEHKSRNN